jgi:hypothetical protein
MNERLADNFEDYVKFIFSLRKPIKTVHTLFIIDDYTISMGRI